MLENKRKDFGIANKAVAAKKKAKENADEELAAVKAIAAEIKEQETVVNELKTAVDTLVRSMGNLVPDSVPIAEEEDGNRVERTWGEPRQEDGLLNHVDMMYRLGWTDLPAGAMVAGGRGFFLREEAVLLNMALINYGLAFLTARTYTPLQTPFFMEKDIMAECAQLDEFDEALYKVSGEGNEKYLIATSEQPISAMHRGKQYEANELPFKYAGFSTCFRKEAGSHGRDQAGIFRIHQFEKIEQFVVTVPDDDESWKAHEEMIKTSEEFYQSLGLPFQVINIASGSINNAAAKKLDLEAWFPASKAFRELVSCSNCTDYQSRRLDARMRKKDGDTGPRFVHMLNSTLIATERAMCCLVETYQTPEGVNIPEVLQPFMGGIKFVPFRRPTEADEAAAKKAKIGSKKK